MRKYFFLVVILLFIFSPSYTFAQSSYVLPYPDEMPGSIFYRFHLVLKNFGKYWFFGNIGQFTYTLKQADKYLVEAKTLFEYKQYLLGADALQKSNVYFKEAPAFLEKAVSEGKNMTEKRKLLKEAAKKHIEILKDIKVNTPEVFNWTPEKSPSTILFLKEDLEKAIKIREAVL